MKDVGEGLAGFIRGLHSHKRVNFRCLPFKSEEPCVGGSSTSRRTWAIGCEQYDQSLQTEGCENAEIKKITRPKAGTWTNGTDERRSASHQVPSIPNDIRAPLKRYGEPYIPYIPPFNTRSHHSLIARRRDLSVRTVLRTQGIVP